MINFKEDEQLHVLNHSCAHMMAQAVKRLYPQAKFWVGPVVNEGFYYDIDLGDDVIKDEDIPKIEKEMKKIAKDGKRITRLELSKEEALEMFNGDEYKLDLINGFDEENVISAYKQGEFVDLCRGPHVETVKKCKNFKLTKHSGAYFKGDKNNKVLQRIYGVCLPTPEDLQNYLDLLEEAKKRDHKKLGKQLELFMINEAAPGMPFFLPKGMKMRKKLEDKWHEEHAKANYDVIKTPVMMSRELWEQSGHWANYQDEMYTTEVDDRKFAIKPMNCPGSILVYANGLHSYKDLPIRLAEPGLVHRHEASGALNGLFRVRAFTQDDAHIYIRYDQIKSEVANIIDIIDKMYSLFGLTYRIELSTRPEDKYIGSIDVWDESEKILADICTDLGKDFKVNPGDGAFYGPKLDFYVEDSLARVWQCGTIQLDMNLPERFGLTYIDSNGEKAQPLMLHRVIFGSIERFMGILIEHFGGAFPTWLAPVQAKVIPVNNNYHLEYAQGLFAELRDLGIDVVLDDRDEKLGYKIREGQIEKVPFLLVLGDNERDENTVTYRRYGQRKQTTVSKQEFFDLIMDEINNYKLPEGE